MVGGLHGLVGLTQNALQCLVGVCGRLGAMAGGSKSRVQLAHLGAVFAGTFHRSGQTGRGSGASTHQALKASGGHVRHFII